MHILKAHSKTSTKSTMYPATNFDVAVFIRNFIRIEKYISILLMLYECVFINVHELVCIVNTGHFRTHNTKFALDLDFTLILLLSSWWWFFSPFSLAISTNFHIQNPDNASRFYGNELPLWNFTDTVHSFMVVVRAMCGEWVESMYDCMLVSDATTSIVYFYALALIGSFVVSYYFVILFSFLFFFSFGHFFIIRAKYVFVYTHYTHFYMYI